MKTVTAPEGYEGCVYWVDATRTWQPAFRRVGDTWWTNAFFVVGHSYTPEAEVLQQAADSIRRSLGLREGACPT